MAENTPAQEQQVNSGGGLGNWFAPLVMVLSLGICILIYTFIMGNPENFQGGDIANNPIPSTESGVGNFLGLMYKGGVLVPLALSLLLTLLIFVVERLITLGRANGKDSLDKFVQKIQMRLEQDDISGAIEECNVQKGTVGNVVKEGLLTYREVFNDDTLDRDRKMYQISKKLQETQALEVPMLERHLVIIATIVSIATLVGLVGTVLGMIKAFSALATAGAPDAVALATGISEALINTAMGVSTSTLATVAYNYFRSRVDSVNYRLDEVGYSILQTFAERVDNK